MMDTYFSPTKCTKELEQEYQLYLRGSVLFLFKSKKNNNNFFTNLKPVAYFHINFYPTLTLMYSTLALTFTTFPSFLWPLPWLLYRKQTLVSLS